MKDNKNIIVISVVICICACLISIYSSIYCLFRSNKSNVVSQTTSSVSSFEEKDVSTSSSEVSSIVVSSSQNTLLQNIYISGSTIEVSNAGNKIVLKIANDSSQIVNYVKSQITIKNDNGDTIVDKTIEWEGQINPSGTATVECDIPEYDGESTNINIDIVDAR